MGFCTHRLRSAHRTSRLRGYTSQIGPGIESSIRCGRCSESSIRSDDCFAHSVRSKACASNLCSEHGFESQALRVETTDTLNRSFRVSHATASNHTFGAAAASSQALGVTIASHTQCEARRFKALSHTLRVHTAGTLSFALRVSLATASNHAFGAAAASSPAFGVAVASYQQYGARRLL